jgi:dienelactone hydrolase
MNSNPQDGSQPTVVLVHGAFAESASWNDVICRLQDQGYTAIAAARYHRTRCAGIEPFAYSEREGGSRKAVAAASCPTQSSCANPRIHVLAIRSADAL